MKQVAAYDSKSKDRPPASIDDAIEDIAANTGLYILMQKRGFTRAQLKSFLVDKPSRETILALTQEAWEGVKISGTPSFVVDGRLLPDIGRASVRARVWRDVLISVVDGH